MLTEALSLPFMQRALLGGILLSILAGYYGPFVVQRRMAFLGSGLGHAAFGGVALGILLDANPLFIALPFTACAAAGMVWIREKSRLETDTAIGIFFAVSMALGIIFLSMKDGYTADAFTYLFGSILAVTTTDLYLIGAVLLLTLINAPAWKRWAYATFDRDLARADRIPVVRDDYLLTISIAVAVVAAIKLVGIILVAAFLVLPAAAARLLARSFAQMCLFSIGLGILSVVTGLATSYATDIPTGPTIIIVQAILFGVLLTLRTARTH
jgi:zinc transport system permease protein